MICWNDALCAYNYLVTSFQCCNLLSSDLVYEGIVGYLNNLATFKKILIPFSHQCIVVRQAKYVLTWSINYGFWEKGQMICWRYFCLQFILFCFFENIPFLIWLENFFHKFVRILLRFKINIIPFIKYTVFVLLVVFILNFDGTGW